MNWQAGFFRLGVLGYAAWLILIGWQAYTDVAIADRIAAAAADQEKIKYEECMASHEKPNFEAIAECGGGDSLSRTDEVPASNPSYWPYVGCAFAPLLALAALWGGIEWVGRGLKEPRKP